jgi:PAS domain S-box-containing protein
MADSGNSSVVVFGANTAVLASGDRSLGALAEHHTLTRIATIEDVLPLVRGPGPAPCLVFEWDAELDLTSALAPLRGDDGLAVCPVVVATARAEASLRHVLQAGAHELCELDGLHGAALVRVIGAASERWQHEREARGGAPRAQGEPPAQAVHVGQDTFKHLVEQSPFGVYTVDADFRLAHVSLGARKVFENVRPLLGRDFADVLRRIWPEPFADEAIGRFRHTLLTGETFRAESTVEQRRDIEALESYDWKLERVMLPDGRPGVVCHFYDLSERQQHDAALRASEAKFRSTFENAAVGIAHVDLKGRWLDVNERLCTITGYERAELLATDFQAITHPDDLGADLALACRVARGELPRYSLEKRYVRKDGREVWVNLTVAGRRGDSGQIEYFISVVEDISARKKAEQAMQAALAASRTGTFRWDLRTDALDWDEALDSLFGLEPGETVRSLEQFLARVHPDDVQGVIERCTRCKTEGADFDMEFRVVTESAELRWLYDRGRTFRGPDGAPAYMTGACVDVTELKRAEVALRARERELHTLADNSPVAFARFDRQLRHVFVNRAVEHAVGMSSERLLGKTHRELGAASEQGDLWDRAISQVFETGEAAEIDFDLCAGADVRHFRARLVPERGRSGDVETVLSVEQDVTVARRYEAELREGEARLRDQDRRKDEFLATLAHELRNPLATLRTGLELLRHSPEGSLQGPRVRDAMERQIEHLVRLVDDLLDVARVNRGQINLRTERVLLADAVRDAVEACAPALAAKSHRLELDLTSEPLAVDADPTRLVQMISNLLTNAAKYTDACGTITVAAGREGGSAVIRVSDTGAGLAPDALAEVWDLFSQVRDTLDRAQGGLGIGLWLVRRLIEMHGGSASAESPGVGRGSTFSLRLPLVASAGALAPKSSTGRSDSERLRIMVVDDNDDAAEMLAMLLRVFEHEVEIAHDGLEALEVATSFQPQLVFLDIGLPGMDGYEVARRLRGLAGTAHSQLVALTGWGGDKDKKLAKQAGFDEHLTKPVAPGVVKDLIHRVAETFAPHARA